MDGILKLTPHIKHYSWGSEDPNSWVGRIAHSIGINQKPFAEAWYGDHKNGPSLVNGISITQVSKTKLNFLGKVLSISKPLSIQLHPDEKMAKELHTRMPEEFIDSHAKEEAAIALTPVDIAYSLVEQNELKQRLKDFPELSLLLDIADDDLNQTTAKDLLGRVLFSSKEKIAQHCKLLWTRLNKQESSLLTKYLIKLEQLYPQGDVGIFVLMLMQIIRLEPSQCITTPTGCPHAYLNGELIEIMAPSDNVLRCGLTDKKINREDFLKALKLQQIAVETDRKVLKDGSITLGNLRVGYLYPGSTVFTGDKPHIVLSLDASGEMKCDGRVESFQPLSSFFITENKTIDIKLDSGRIISFGSD